MRAGRFCIVFQINMVREISILQEYQTKFWDQQYFKESWPRDFFILGKWNFCKKTSLV